MVLDYCGGLFGGGGLFGTWPELGVFLGVFFLTAVTTARRQSSPPYRICYAVTELETLSLV